MVFYWLIRKEAFSYSPCQLHSGEVVPDTKVPKNSFGKWSKFQNWQLTVKITRNRNLSLANSNKYYPSLAFIYTIRINKIIKFKQAIHLYSIQNSTIFFFYYINLYVNMIRPLLGTWTYPYARFLIYQISLLFLFLLKSRESKRG